jgi:hypothetical protein
MIDTLIIAWFVQRFLPGMSLAPPERSEVVAWAMLEVAIVACLFAAVFFVRLKARSIFGLRSPADRLAFGLLGVWLAMCAINTVAGVWRGNDWGYLAGDAYRFSSVPLLIGLVYYGVRNGGEVQRLIRGFVGFYGCMVALDLVRFDSSLPLDDPRLTTETAHEAGLVVAAVAFLMLYDRRRAWRVFSGAVLLMIFVLLFRAQMLTPLLTSLAALVLFFFFSRRLTVLLACAGAAALLVGASLYASAVSPEATSYISDKLDAAQMSSGALESVQALSGVRSGEIFFIVDALTSHPLELRFGAGEGALVSPDPVVAVERLLIDKHYVHAGLFDALYHNGIAAVGAFLGFCAGLFRRAFHLHATGNPFGLFVMVTVAVALVLLSYDLPMESSVPLLALCFTGVCSFEMPESAHATPAGPPFSFPTGA